MRLNKFQKAWIDRLISGKTRKCRNELYDGSGRNCCLGVAINVCKLERIQDDDGFDDLANFPETRKALNIKHNGGFNISKVKPKWKEKIKSDQYSLIKLNDNTDMTHKEIGQFINENREAVFIG